MIPVRIAGATRPLGAPKDWDPTTDPPCGTLWVRDTTIQGEPYMVSRWEPTPRELELLIAGRPVELFMPGIAHPPVAIGVPEE